MDELDILKLSIDLMRIEHETHRVYISKGLGDLFRYGDLAYYVGLVRGEINLDIDSNDGEI